MKISKNAVVPLLLGFAMAIGMVLGFGLAGGSPNTSRPEWEKINQILQYVENDYVDTVSRTSLEDEVIAYLLQRLDPHSFYIDEQKLSKVNESLNGGFEGIGIQFRFKADTVYVIQTISGGPSELAGLKAGDKMIKAAGTTIAGVGMSTEEVMAILKGESGTEVDVVVQRNHELKTFTIERGTIALSSIDAAYLINDSTIYLKLDRFAKNTYQEFQDAVYPLLTDDVTAFVLDLRGNGGGFLDAAVDVADEFLADNTLITYTEGKARPKAEYFATSNGRLTELDLSILIDGYSASASEIIAGCMQDHERAVIYGRRSYGKGLVQEQNEWADGSATRLTVARYYTPLGRSIQRSYAGFADDVVTDSATIVDRGGIIPDVEIERDTTGITWLFAELVHRGWLTDFTYTFRDEQPEYGQMTFEKFDRSVSDTTLLDGLRHYLDEKPFSINEGEWKRSAPIIGHRLKALMARSLYTDQEYYIITNRTDNAIREIIRAKKSQDV